MRYICFCALLLACSFTISLSQVTDSDVRFKMATDFVKQKKYAEAIVIFEELANNNEHDAQFNLAFLINEGKGTTKNYREALFWAFLSRLGQIEKAEDLSEELVGIIPENVLKSVREKVLQHLLDRFELKDIAVLVQLGDFYLVVLEEKDYENAYLWYNVASALGVENSSDKRDDVERELEPDKIIKIQMASRKKYQEFIKKEISEGEKKIRKTEEDYES